jgi:hypothetical protein
LTAGCSCCRQVLLAFQTGASSVCQHYHLSSMPIPHHLILTSLSLLWNLIFI